MNKQEDIADYLKSLKRGYSNQQLEKVGIRYFAEWDGKEFKEGLKKLKGEVIIPAIYHSVRPNFKARPKYALVLRESIKLYGTHQKFEAAILNFDGKIVWDFGHEYFSEKVEYYGREHTVFDSSLFVEKFVPNYDEYYAQILADRAAAQKRIEEWKQACRK
jgi:hypothetical protein